VGIVTLTLSKSWTPAAVFDYVPNVGASGNAEVETKAAAWKRAPPSHPPSNMQFHRLRNSGGNSTTSETRLSLAAAAARRSPLLESGKEGIVEREKSHAAEMARAEQESPFNEKVSG
jgi:hypothetical protein